MGGPPGHREAGAQPFALDDPAARTAYLRLWETSPQRTVFAHPDYVAAAAEAFGYAPHLIAVPGEDGFAAALPVFEKHRMPFRAAAMPPLTFLVTPLLAGPLKATDVHARRSPLDALLSALAERYHQANLLLHPSLTDARPLLWAGWRVTPRYTYVVDLDTLDRTDWSQTARWRVNKEARRYRIAEDPAGADAALAFTAEAYRRRGGALGLDPGALQRFVSVLLDAGLARAFGAFAGGAAAPEAAVVVLSDGRTALYWLAGSRPGPSMTVLLADILARLAAEPCERFDFGGANIPSIAEFKRKFGGRLVPYFHARIAVHPALRLLDRLRP